MKVAIEPKSFAEYETAVVLGGGRVVSLDNSVRAVIWTDYSKPQALSEMLDSNPQIEWVQLPFAGVDAFAKVLSRPVRFTSAKGAYREPVAEHALALSLALMRVLPERARSLSWGRQFAATLYGANVVVVGGGGITEEFLKLIAPFKANVTVVRKRPQAMPGANQVLAFEQLDVALSAADLVVLAAALTPETHHLFDAARFAVMKPGSFLVNIARGPMVKTEDLIEVLESGHLAGAALDVTDPEPLPDGHPLWSAMNILITPHTADTREMVVRLFSERVTQNVRAYKGEGPWVGVVDPILGY
ncbi:NAD(P)-dependent oxidoreductase [Rhodoluna sp.]|uniref:NAD(P)-dependent oxidoreductase n=1 Tax=Rhodoluna sp. TaxID=1969481 RepID=UPI0025D443CB|nr:NAD(P)-dependent oxidoreductase [Rhodoluna sp.]